LRLLNLIFATKHSSWTGLPSSLTFACSRVIGLPQIAHLIGAGVVDMGDEGSNA
jgi:hypothetical protein